MSNPITAQMSYIHKHFSSFPETIMIFVATFLNFFLYFYSILFLFGLIFCESSFYKQHRFQVPID